MGVPCIPVLAVHRLMVRPQCRPTRRHTSLRSRIHNPTSTLLCHIHNHNPLRVHITLRPMHRMLRPLNPISHTPLLHISSPTPIMDRLTSPDILQRPLLGLLLLLLICMRLPLRAIRLRSLHEHQITRMASGIRLFPRNKTQPPHQIQKIPTHPRTYLSLHLQRTNLRLHHDSILTL
jgi:hypothetical protein